MFWRPPSSDRDAEKGIETRTASEATTPTLNAAEDESSGSTSIGTYHFHTRTASKIRRTQFEMGLTERGRPFPMAVDEHVRDVQQARNVEIRS